MAAETIKEILRLARLATERRSLRQIRGHARRRDALSGAIPTLNDGFCVA